MSGTILILYRGGGRVKEHAPPSNHTIKKRALAIYSDGVKRNA